MENSLLKVNGKSNIASIKESFIYNCGYTIVKSSYNSVYYHTPIEITDSEFDKIIFGNDPKDITITNALKDEISGRNSSKLDQGLSDKYPTLLIDILNNNPIFYNYSNAYTNEKSNYIIIDNLLYYTKDLTLCSNIEGWQKITGYS